MSSERLIYAFHNKQLYIFERAERCGHSHFGGPLPSEIIGQTFGPKPLHQVARLSSWHIPALDQNYTNELPLIFGMYFDGCQLSYRVHSRHRVEILKIKPDRSLDDWPYPNFPPLLPYIPLRLEDTPRSESYDHFARRFENMPSEPAELMACVPAPATIGLSFWGSGDAGVTIVFECNLQSKEVTSYAMTD